MATDGFSAASMPTARIPNIPVRNMTGRTTIPAIRNPLRRVPSSRIVYTRCHDPWLNISAARMAMMRVTPNSIPAPCVGESSSGLDVRHLVQHVSQSVHRDDGGDDDNDQ